MSKRPHGHGDLKNMRDFKAVAVDYAYYLTLSDEPVSVCLTERQMYVLSVQNTYTAWLTRWYNTEDISQKVVQLIAAEIEDLLMCGCGVPALTPTDVFNTTNYVNNTTEIYNNTQNTWYEGDQTVFSIAPNLDFDTGDPVDISKMVCAAVELLVRSILAEGKTINEATAATNTNLLNVISSAMSGLATAAGAAALIEGFAASALAFLAGPWMVLGLALGAVGLKIATLFMGADNSLFENEEAIANVICAMQQNLDNKQVDRAAFAGALTPNDFGPGSPEAQLAALIQPFLDDLDTYLQFMVAGNGLYSKVNFAVMPDCGCADETCDDLKTGEHDWVRLDPVYAVYHPGEGFGRGSDNSRIGIMKNITGTVVEFTVTFNEVIDGYQGGVFPGYNSFGSEDFFTTVGGKKSFTRTGSWPAGLAFELIGAPISSTLRCIKVCYTLAS